MDTGRKEHKMTHPVDTLMHREEITVLHSTDDDGYFSWFGCTACGVSGHVYACVGENPTRRAREEGSHLCGDCLHYATYGEPIGT